MARLKTQLDLNDLTTLVVEDVDIHRDHLEKALKIVGFANIDHASSMNDALKKMELNAYNIIFVDWNMPGKSGYHFLQTCRSDETFNRVAFVMVSSETEERSIAEAMRAGANAYVIKPVQLSALKEQMNHVLAWIERGRPS